MACAFLIIDPQNDFCSPDGALFIPGSPQNCSNTAAFIRKNAAHIDSIHITLDSHPSYHIAHPVFWKDADGAVPPPFTQITYRDFAAGKFRPIDEAAAAKTEKYLQELEAKGRYNLILWPLHCLQGTGGMAVEKNIWQAAHDWELAHPFCNIDYTTKASNVYTEHYSALQAEVPDPEDTSTLMNFTLINKLKKADRIIIAGQALSHCVANTVRDLSAFIPPASFVLLKDCTSPVAGFEKNAQVFVQEMEKRGMTTSVSCELQL
ncbi:hypothetical protein H0R92_00515 [Treponema sp. OMZ 840]|uniref:hypothetical protein n=1 Tax=Treponema sp. OMZ 840 TaxID=244313 RepID=UPI003D916F6F